ncbi:hypothetical protein [Stenomitos frigidus]|uniref:Uncharacterized protein n=1 Tax=Stenomitos frigidus ULC18 TaxID=2107698 RepID=A0A2T1E6F1_9CYAN|nr:hypothetical protein [Stenomitos frigidus]PSB28319.1 hypothetical protein C7B82_14055 [Stenomitos frigidus ULC18]
MKRFSPQFKYHSLRRYSTIGGMGLLLLVGGLALRPALKSNADVPQVLAGSDREKSQAKAAFRVEQRQEQSRQIRPENFALDRYPVTNKNEKYWRNLLWTTAVVQPQEDFVASTIEQILSMALRPKLSDAQKRTIDMAVRVGTQLYLSDPNRYVSLGERFQQTIDRSPDPEWVAMSLSGLARGGLSPEQIQALVGRVKARFPNWSANVSLQTTLREMAELISPGTVPPLGDLLNWTIAPKQVQLYVLCQQDRDVLCQTVLKDGNGAFVRQQDGQLWSVPLLLRSIHGLSWNFIRGETPQGIYRMEGVVPQPDDEFFRAYGQFPLVKLFVPFEPGAKQFVPGKAGAFRGTLADYRRLLPPSWRNYWAIQESFWAGKSGRSYFRIHGTGESPDFFSGKDRNPDIYNWNPTIGCLSALELYNEQGQLLQADMPKLLNALQAIGGQSFSGYVVVIDLPGKARTPIALDAIEAALRGGKLTLSTTRQRHTLPTKSAKALAMATSQSLKADR